MLGNLSLSLTLLLTALIGCRSYEVVAEGLQIDGVAVDATHVYWLDFELWRAPKEGGRAEVVHPDFVEPHALQQHDGSVYFADYMLGGDDIYRAGRGIPTRVARGVSSKWTVLDGQVFSVGSSGRVSAYDASGGTVVAQAPCPDPGGCQYDFVAVDGDYLYVIDTRNDVAYRFYPLGGPPQHVANLHSVAMHGFAASDETLYWLGGQPGVMNQLYLAYSPEIAPVPVSQPSRIEGLTFADGRVYWGVASGTYGIRTSPIRGVTADFHRLPHRPVALTHDAEWLYAALDLDLHGQVIRIPLEEFSGQ